MIAGEKIADALYTRSSLRIAAASRRLQDNVRTRMAMRRSKRASGIQNGLEVFSTSPGGHRDMRIIQVFALPRET
jgi:hypothetical protein